MVSSSRVPAFEMILETQLILGKFNLEIKVEDDRCLQLDNVRNANKHICVGLSGPETHIVESEHTLEGLENLRLERVHLSLVDSGL